jgi:dihydrofolate synthase / folylpolyglutamate synthase
LDEAEPDPNYRATLAWVWSFSARQRSADEMAAQRAVKLERMQALLERLGHPEQRFPSVLVAGTKGKGSTVAMLSACFQAAGFHTGRYTSPHLVNWRERVCVDAEPFSTDEVIALSKPIHRAVESLPRELGTPTTFEVGTAFAFLHFARQPVDLAVVEVGTGGRLDATNVLSPSASVITPISYDHTLTLGSTLTSIAAHKAGILRQRRPAILAPQADEARRVIEAEAERLGASLDEVGRDWRWFPESEGIRVESSHPDFEPLRTHVGLLGDHQRDNATVTVATLHAVKSGFNVPRPAIESGLRNVEWPGRLQVLSERPLVVLDGAHNAASAEVVQRALATVFEFDRLIIVIGLSEGKDALGVLNPLAPRADRLLLTRSKHERSADPEPLAALAQTVAPGAQTVVFRDAANAFDAALAEARPGDMVLITGSLFLVGEALAWWHRSPR